MPTKALQPDFYDIEAARERLAGRAHHTPVVTSRTLNHRLGKEVYFKCENLQRIGVILRGGNIDAATMSAILLNQI